MAKETPSKRAKPASGPPRTKATLAGTGQTQPVYAGSKSELAGTGQVVLATVTPKATARAAQRARRAQRQRTRAILRSKPAKAQKRSQPVAYHPPKSVPQSKPPTFKGQKTAGAPSLKELSQAQNEQKLGTNKAGFVTTPGVRRAAKQLKKARRVYAKHAYPHISGLHTKAQQEFAEAFSKASHIPPKLAGEWVKQESGASAAGQGGEAGEQNELGIGYPAHPTSMSESHYFNNVSPKRAGINSAKWLEGKIGGEFNYHAAPSITGISKLAKSGASEAQIRSYIEGPSGWGTGAISQGGVTAHGGKASPKIRAKLKRAKAQAEQVGLNTEGQQGKQANYRRIFGKQIAQQLHLVKSGQLTKGPGKLILYGTSSISQGHEPEIAARLKLLSAKLGKPVYVISGYRTPQHSVEVGGFSNDPHTKGEAADIGVGSPTLASAAAIPESAYESVGLYRPFGTARGGSSAEDNHVQLLNGGTPATGGSGATPGGTSAGTGAVSSSSIAAYASATGQPVKVVRQKLKKHKLTPQQILNKLKRFDNFGGGTTKAKAAPGEGSSVTLADLEKKYGRAAA